MDIKRITSALLGFPLVVIILTFGNKYVVDIFLAFIAMLGMQEYFNAVSKEAKPVRWIGYLTCLVISLIHIVPDNLNIQFQNEMLMLLLPCIMLALFLHVIITNMKINFKDIAYTLFGIIYVIGCIIFLALLRGIQSGRILIWYAIIAAWGTDIFAYLIGKRFGKHKFSEVSPKKSIEGCIAGIIGAVAIAVLYTFAINKIFDLQYSYLFVVIVTAILSMIGQVGDFAASSIKRSVGIKDFSNLIPGHGGLLDRIDSLIFVAPFAYILLDMMFILGGKI